MTPTSSSRPLSLRIARGFDTERQALEVELERVGVRLAVFRLVDWLKAEGHVDAILLAARDETGAVLGTAVVGISRTRALPGHLLYQVTRFMSTGNDLADRALLAGIAEAARRDRRCLRLTIELFERDDERRRYLGVVLGELGFLKKSNPRSYRRTLVIDVTPGADQLLADLNGKVRREIRAPGKRGLELRPVEDAALADRLRELMDATYARTGGTAQPYPWRTLVDLAKRYPDRARVTGLFDPATPGVESLVGFSVGVMHGNCATYEAGASIRRPDLGRTPLAYAPLWDLIAWAARTPPATWFDFGGVTVPVPGVEDPLAGISEFKHYFTHDMVEPGEDWTLEPRRLQSALARVVSAVAKRVAAR